MLFHEAEQNKTYTISRIRGRGIAAALEARGIAKGSDLVILSSAGAKGAPVRLVNGREVLLSKEETESLILEEPWLRKASDPVFLGGCCGGTTGIWDKYLKDDAPDKM